MSTQSALHKLARRLRGRRVLGGCDECSAFQTLAEDGDLPGVFHLRVHHDD